MKIQDPSQTSNTVKIMAPRLAKVSALMGGTEAMREAGQSLLPKYDAESDQNYNYRLNRAVLLNVFKRAVETMAGKPFSKPVQVKEFPSALEFLIDDADNNGNNLNTFARNTFKSGLVDGLTHVLVEYPDVASEGPKSLEDERKLSARPYFCHIPHCSIIAAYAEVVNGVERLTHVRILEEETIRDGFEEYSVTRVRVLEPGHWELWEKEKKKWSKVKEGETTINYIPLLTFYADRESFMVARPPLTDLADLNIAHWQSSSDQRNILTLTRFPILAGSGLNEEESNIKIGPNKLLTSQSKDGKFYYVEHTGAAIAAGRTDLQDLKEEMAVMSVQLLQRSGNITATEKSIDTAQSTSTLQDIALRFGDFLERCLYVAGEWAGLKEDQITGSVSLNTDFNLSDVNQTDLTKLIEIRKMKEISHEQFITELKRRDLIADDFDVELDIEKIKQEEDRQLELDIMRNELLGLNPDGTPRLE